MSSLRRSRPRCVPPFVLLLLCLASTSACGDSARNAEIGAAAATDSGVPVGEGGGADPSMTPPQRGKIAVVLTVDWEGREISEANITAMETLRAKFPDIPIVHFLNAAYFTKPGANAAAISATIRRVMHPNDELGLHIHGWKSLFDASGVTFRRGPTFWGTTLTDQDCADDCGHEVPISIYTTAELQKVISFSVKKLEANGFGHATSFRAGGWMANDNVRAALALERFAFDHSAVPSKFLAGELKGYPRLTSVEEMWPLTTEGSQPYAIAAGTGTLTEVPDNGALADYVAANEMLGVFDGAARTLTEAPLVDRVVSIGFHQETAKTYLPRIDGALAGIAQRAASGLSVPVAYVTSKGVPITK